MQCGVFGQYARSSSLADSFALLRAQINKVFEGFLRRVGYQNLFSDREKLALPTSR